MPVLNLINVRETARLLICSFAANSAGSAGTLVISNTFWEINKLAEHGERRRGNIAGLLSKSDRKCQARCEKAGIFPETEPTDRKTTGPTRLWLNRTAQKNDRGAAKDIRCSSADMQVPQ
jgi:hypothetical protein